MIYFLKFDWWGVPLILFVLTDGERDGLWWTALSGHWLSCTGCCQYLLNMNCLMYGLLLLKWTSFISYLHTIPRKISRNVSGLATNSPCGVGAVDEPLASDLGFLFLNASWSASLTYWKWIFYWCFFIIIVIIHCPNVTFIIPLIWFRSEIAGTIIFHRRSLCSFLLQWFLTLRQYNFHESGW